MTIPNTLSISSLLKRMNHIGFIILDINYSKFLICNDGLRAHN